MQISFSTSVPFQSRIKGGVKRRPPTRKGRQTTTRMSAAEISVPSFATTPEATTRSEPTTPIKAPDDSPISSYITPPDFDESDSVPTYTTSNLPDDIFSPDTEEEDMFAVASFNSDPFDHNQFSDDSLFPASKKPAIVIDDNLFSQDSPASSKRAGSTSKDGAKKGVFDDLNDDIFDVAPSKSGAKVKAQPANDDDLFSVASSKTAKSGVGKTLSKDDDVDDIFKVPSSRKKSGAAKNDQVWTIQAFYAFQAFHGKPRFVLALSVPYRHQNVTRQMTLLLF